MATTDVHTERPEDLFVFKLHILHPTERPYMNWDIWKHRANLDEKVALHLRQALGVGEPESLRLTARLLNGETLVFPYATNVFSAPGAVLVPDARAIVVGAGEAGRM
ncbi:MAG: hypothetical protein U5K81_10130 [Trueperaceae bacterium]|nr:hypothetical protein [Trueperaceae bacterium]